MNELVAPTLVGYTLFPFTQWQRSYQNAITIGQRKKNQLSDIAPFSLVGNSLTWIDSTPLSSVTIDARISKRETIVY